MSRIILAQVYQWSETTSDFGNWSCIEDSSGVTSPPLTYCTYYPQTLVSNRPTTTPYTETCYTDNKITTCYSPIKEVSGYILFIALFIGMTYCVYKVYRTL